MRSETAEDISGNPSRLAPEATDDADPSRKKGIGFFVRDQNAFAAISGSVIKLSEDRQPQAECFQFNLISPRAA